MHKLITLTALSALFVLPAIAFAAEPIITSHAPAIVVQNGVEEIYGQNLSTATGIEFRDTKDNSVLAVFNTQNFTYADTGSGYGKLSFTIPASFMGMVGAGQYNVAVLTADSHSSPFLLTVAGNITEYPTIDSYFPGGLHANEMMEVLGQHLQFANAVKFYENGSLIATSNNVSVSSVSANQDKVNFLITQTFVGMVGAGTYQAKIVTPNGETAFFPVTVLDTPAPTPVINSLAPTIAYPDITVLVNGTNLKNATDVELYRNGAFSASNRLDASRVTDTSVAFPMGIMGANIESGLYSLRIKTSDGYSNFIPFNFSTTPSGGTYVPTQSAVQSPVISSVVPGDYSPTDMLTIYGTRLSGVVAVGLYSPEKSLYGSFLLNSGAYDASITDTSVRFRVNGGFVQMNHDGQYYIAVRNNSEWSNLLPINYHATPAKVPTTVQPVDPRIAALQAQINALMAQLAAQRAGTKVVIPVSQVSSVVTPVPVVSPVSSISTSLPTPSVTATSSVGQCSFKNLQLGIGYGWDDKLSGNAVSSIQNFLKKRGHLKVNPTGYYGNMTVASLKAFQKSVNIPQTGKVDAATYGALRATDTCK